MTPLLQKWSNCSTPRDHPQRLRNRSRMYMDDSTDSICSVKSRSFRI